MSAPLVSIIIPTYNRADFIEETVASVLCQTLPDFEIIVVDDGSIDDTADRVAAIGDKRIHYLSHANIGRARSVNRGAAFAHGAYMALLDSDDLYLPDKLAVQVQYLETHRDIGLVAGGFQYIDRNGQVINEVRPWLFDPPPSLTVETLVVDCVVGPPHVALFRRDWFTTVGGMDKSVELADDWDLWIRMALAGCRMAWVEELVCAYRLHDANSIRQARNHRDALYKVWQKTFYTPDLPDHIQGLELISKGAVLLQGACRQFASGTYADGMTDLVAALEAWPALGVGNPPPLIQTVGNWSMHPLVQDRETFWDGVTSHWPWPEREMRRWLRKQQARCYMAEFFGKYQTLSGKQVCHLLWQALRLDRKYLLNRGLWSIAVRSLFT